MLQKINQKIRLISPSKSITFASEVAKLASEGKKIYRFNVGEPDFFPHESVIQATKEALDHGHVRYSLVPGTLELRNKIAEVDSGKYNLKIDSENIFIANGSKNVLYNIFQLICTDQDEVIIPKPYWVSFPEQVKLSGAKPVFVDPNTDLTLNIKNIIDAISTKTKAIILNFPNNPSGSVPSNNLIQEILKITKEKEIFLILDLAYEETIFQNTKIDLSKYDSIPNNLILVKSFSKSYALTGFRIGYCIASDLILKHLKSLQGHLCGNPCTFAQDGALAALNLPDKYLTDMKEQFLLKMNTSFNIVKDIFPDLTPPGGGFYLFPNATHILSKMNLSDSDFCIKLLNDKHVAILPGSAFGMDGHLRICFATSIEDIEVGLKKLKEFIL